MTVGYKHPEVQWNGLTVTDLFCGAGGSSSGLVEAGYKVVIAANHWALAIESHQVNHPETVGASREDESWQKNGDCGGRTAARAGSSSQTRRAPARAAVNEAGTQSASPAGLSRAARSTTRPKTSAERWSPGSSATYASSLSARSATVSSSSSRSTTTTRPERGAACSASGATRRSVCSATTRTCCGPRPSTSRTLRDSSSSSSNQRTRGGAR